MNQLLKKYCDDLQTEFDIIPAERKIILEQISNYILQKNANNRHVNLVYICTHNSRRSHFGQVWAHVAAAYFEAKNVHTFSGGTVVTAFNPNAIQALRRIGFDIQKMSGEENPIYHAFYDKNEKPIICFSKEYTHSDNPEKNYAAIMTCSEAEENCPFTPGAEMRISTTYEDPSLFDNTTQQDSKYDERCRQMAREIFYVFFKTIQK